MEPTFRKATASDIKEIYSVMKKAGYIDIFYGGKSEEIVIPQLIKNLFDSKNNITIIIGEVNRQIVAYSMFGPYAQYKSPRFPEEKENFAYSKGFGAYPEGKGYGTMILVATESFAKKEGYKGMYTDVASNNKASLRVQEKAGFQRIGEFEDKKRPMGVRSVVFRKIF